jgi:hypothetical protein
MRILVDMILKDLDPLFRERYAEDGRPSIPPEPLRVNLQPNSSPRLLSITIAGRFEEV